MNVFHRVAQRSMRANRMRTIVTIIGVILSAAMFTAVTTFATTLMTHLQRVTAYLDGAYLSRRAQCGRRHAGLHAGRQ